MKASPGLSPKSVINAFVKRTCYMLLRAICFVLVSSLTDTMYVVSQSGDCFFKCTPRDRVSRVRPSILALVSYTVKILFLFKVVVCSELKGSN